MRLILFIFLLSAIALSQPYISPFAPPVFTSDPAACSPPAMYFNTISLVYKGCTAINTWTTFATGAGTVSNCSTIGSIGYYSTTGTTVSCAGGNLTFSSGHLAANAVQFGTGDGTGQVNMHLIDALPTGGLNIYVGKDSVGNRSTSPNPTLSLQTISTVNWPSNANSCIYCFRFENSGGTNNGPLSMMVESRESGNPSVGATGFESLYVSNSNVANRGTFAGFFVNEKDDTVSGANGVEVNNSNRGSLDCDAQYSGGTHGSCNGLVVVGYGLHKNTIALGVIVGDAAATYNYGLYVGPGAVYGAAIQSDFAGPSLITANNQYLQWKDAGGTPRNLLGFDGSNALQISQSAYLISLNSTTVLPNNTYIGGTSTGSVHVPLALIDASNNIHFGATATSVTTFIDSAAFVEFTTNGGTLAGFFDNSQNLTVKGIAGGGKRLACIDNNGMLYGATGTSCP